MAKILSEGVLDNVTLTVTSEVATLPIENLQNTQPSQIWRSTTAADQVISWSTTDSKLYDSVLLYGHNLSIGDTITFELSNLANFATTEYSYVHTVGQIDYGLGLGTLGVSPTSLGGYVTSDKVKVFSHFFSKTFAKYGRLTIEHNAATLSYIEAARIKAGLALTTTLNVDTGYSVGYELSDELFETYANGLYAIERPKYRTANLTWSFLSFTNALSMQDMIYNTGSSGDVFISPYYFESTSRTRLSEILGRITSVSDIDEVISGPVSTSRYFFNIKIREGL